MKRIIASNKSNTFSHSIFVCRESGKLFIVKTILLIFFLGSTIALSGQNIKIEVSKDSVLVNQKFEYSLKLQIIGGKPPYNVELYDNLKRNGGILVAKRENFSGSLVDLSNLSGNRQIYIYVECLENRQGITTLIRL